MNKEQFAALVAQIKAMNFMVRDIWSKSNHINANAIFPDGDVVYFEYSVEEIAARVDSNAVLTIPEFNAVTNQVMVDAVLKSACIAHLIDSDNNQLSPIAQFFPEFHHLIEEAAMYF